jgi:hypothetical protein
MKASASSDLNSTKWSESIIVLGKGTPNWSTKYGCTTYCIAGVGEHSGWLRLYPVLARRLIDDVPQIQIFDIIRTVYRQEKPEPHRPESRKIYPENLIRIGSLEPRDRGPLLRSKTEDGKFLHDSSWNGRKTLGLIKPEDVHFSVTGENFPKVRFRCNACESQKSHITNVNELIQMDEFGRTYKQRLVSRDELQTKISNFQDKDLRFVMGTMNKRPQIWILIAIHKLESI